MKTQLDILTDIFDNFSKSTKPEFIDGFLKAMEKEGYKLVETNPSKFSQIVNSGSFIRKGRGRIFVQTQEEVAKVNALIEAIDEFESGYMGKTFVTVLNEEYSPYSQLEYSGKFEMEVKDIINKCNEAGIDVRILTEVDDD